PSCARRVGGGCSGAGVSAGDGMVVLPCGGSVGASPRRGEVPAVRPAPGRGAPVRLACPRRRGAVPRPGGGRPLKNGRVGSPGGASPRRRGRGIREEPRPRLS